MIDFNENPARVIEQIEAWLKTMPMEKFPSKDEKVFDAKVYVDYATNMRMNFDYLLRLVEEYRSEAIKWRTLFGEGNEPVGKYSDMPIIIDEEVHRRMKEGK